MQLNGGGGNAMFRAAMVATGAFIMVAGPVVAQTSPAESSAAGGVANDDSNRIVCKKQEQIGSRLGAKKRCLTEREWQARQQEDRDQLEKGQSDSRTRLSKDPG